MKHASTEEVRKLYAAALFWDAIETAAMTESLDGELPDADWDAAEERANAAKIALADAITGWPRIGATRAVRLVYGSLWELEDHIPELEGISATGTWAQIVGRSA